jgi:hypothetical protein
MKTLMDLYVAELHHYTKLISSLCTALESVVTMQPITRFGYEFVPSKASISEEIKHWPESVPPIPPSGWVEPRKGTIELYGDIWEFAFHGAGLSFFHNQTRQDISLEYTNTGEHGITEWTTQVYIKTLPSSASYIQDLLAQHANLFNQLVKLGYLRKTIPFLGEGVDDETFIFLPQNTG